ncbi:MAG: hypothetical protein ACE5LB_18425 [Acidiferrobacterales bacterium]
MATSLSGGFWELLEGLSNFFYNPAIFWGLPLVLAVLWAIYRRLPSTRSRKQESDQARDKRS